MAPKNQIVIYKSGNRKVEINVDINRDTVWLTQKQMSQLFDKTVPTINEHIKNVYKEKELNLKSTIRKFRTVEKEGNRQVAREIDHYNLDVVISVGYRVKSIRGTQFRIWATKTLKQYLVKGYVLNKKRLTEQQKYLKNLSDSVEIIRSKIKSPMLAGQEEELLGIVKKYIDSIKLLKRYDDRNLETKNLSLKTGFELEYEKVIENVLWFRQELLRQKLASDLFGAENSTKLQGLIGAINQTFDGKYLYPSIEEKAANLLYFVIKDHPFVDGNKRIGSTLFIYFLNKNRYLFKKNGEVKINDRALVALALLVAVSDPKEKETIVKLVINLIKD